MPELDQLFTEFVERHLAGEDPDPWSYIDQLSDDEREELAELIDAYFVGAPPRTWDFRVMGLEALPLWPE